MSRFQWRGSISPPFNAPLHSWGFPLFGTSIHGRRYKTIVPDRVELRLSACGHPVHAATSLLRPTNSGASKSSVTDFRISRATIIRPPSSHGPISETHCWQDYWGSTVEQNKRIHGVCRGQTLERTGTVLKKSASLNTEKICGQFIFEGQISFFRWFCNS